MEAINANSRSQLLEAISNIDITVPPRTHGRKTEHREKYSIVRYLKTLVVADRLIFPLQLIHRDRPDFLLSQNQQQTGVECTEAIPKQCAWAMALWEEYYPDGNFEPDFFKWDAPERTREEILGILSRTQEGLHGDPWYGDSVEKDWAKWMADCIDKKTEKLNAINFKTFEWNHLLIYDNLPQAVNDLHKSVEMLCRYLERVQVNLSLRFNRIIIESQNSLVEISPLEIVMTEMD